MTVGSFTPLLLALILAPLMLGIISRTKAIAAGRVGPPLLQTYYDLMKLLRKGTVYSGTTTWIFRAGPIVGLAAVVVATTLIPLGGFHALIAFPGDFIALVYVLAVMRFSMVLAALDTGSSFEGMGASREVTISALAEPALLFGFVALAHQGQHLSLSEMYGALSLSNWAGTHASMILIAVSWLVVLLAENSRIPIDDPTTHLELTMIHEVITLDHSGPDLAFILYGAALKLWLLGILLIGLILPIHHGTPGMETVWALSGMLGLAVGIGVIESVMARLRLTRIPQLLIGAGACAFLALLLVLQ